MNHDYHDRETENWLQPNHLHRDEEWHGNCSPTPSEPDFDSEDEDRTTQIIDSEIDKRERRVYFAKAKTALCRFAFLRRLAKGVFDVVIVKFVSDVLLKGDDSIGGATFTGISLLAYSLANLVSTPMWGAVADQYGRKKILLRGSYVSSLALVLMGTCLQYP